MGEAAQFYSAWAQEFLENYYRDSDFRERYGLWGLLLEKYAVHARKAYDMGCGPGLLSFYLARMGVEVTGIDASEEMLGLCAERKEKLGIQNLHFVQARLPCPKKIVDKVDLILSSSLFEYIENLGAMMDWVSELLNPKGFLIFSLPNAKSLYRRYAGLKYRLTGRPEYYQFVKNIFGLTQTIRLLEKRGFVCRDAYYYGRSHRLSRLASVFLRPIYSDNLFVAVFEKR